MRLLALGTILLMLLSGCATTQSTVVQSIREDEPHPLSASDFQWDPTFPFTGEEVSFTPQVKSSVEDDRIVALAWDFGSGPVQMNHPVHTFSAAGPQSVSLTIETAGGGTWVVTKNISVTERHQEEPQEPSDPDPSPDPAPEPGSDDTTAPAPTILVSQDKGTVSLSFQWDRTAELVYWELGDGTTSNEQRVEHTYEAPKDYTILLRVSAADVVQEATRTLTIESTGFIPHVIVAIPDSGINPYHSMYHRPGLTEHPCKYIEDFPCTVKELPLSVGQHDSWNAAYQADQALWSSIRPDTWYWIPETAFVAVMAEGPCDGVCILDDTSMHGTGTTSSALTENPDALIAFKEGGSGIRQFYEGGIPVDVYSVSWGYTVPIPLLPSGVIDDIIYVKSAGNDPRSSLIDGWSGDPRVISVGGAYANGNTEEEMATKQPEIVSYYCRPTAQTNSIHDMRPSYCGTSFAGPTAAGALSQVILDLRRTSGYTGSVENGMVDPILGISIHDLRGAMNRTASYDPEAQYSNRGIVPLNPAAPWVQWGWGFYDGLVAPATTAHLLGEKQPAKPDEAVLYMETVYTAKQLTHPLS